MSNARILRQNYLDSSLLLSQTYSSQQGVAPATNVLALTRRTKTYRSNGYWKITSSNNVIKFKETGGGSVLTASIAVAEYLTDATFLLAVKAALQAAGSSTYTVARNTTTKKIVITSSGTGGGGVFQLLLSNAGFTAATILGFTTALDLTGALNYTADTLKIHTSEWIRWDLGIASLVQAFTLIGKRNEGIQLTSSAVITLMGNSTDVWTSPQYSQVLTWNEDAISAFNTAGLYASGLRYWRLEIADPSNPDGYIEISNLYLGELYSPTQGAIQFPFDTTLVDLSKTDYGSTGVAFVNAGQVTEELSIKWYGLTITEKEYLESFIKIYSTAYPFFISLDPDSVFSSSVSKWVRYCRFQSVPKFSLESPNLFSATWDLREEL